MEGQELNITEFGESVWYMKANLVGKDKLDSRWESGIFLGVGKEIGDRIVGTKD